ncbi:ferredoxin-thioredoxin reductase, variable chain-like [Typha latifolia]|uniref:ferredoxin-thioredoxin reductase, variable chain-like n=1 Tax=Typha latifolia TaxID=4733 RepID=UPI003C305737
MPIAATTTSGATSFASYLIRRQPPLFPPLRSPPSFFSSFSPIPSASIRFRARRRLSCQVAITGDISSSSDAAKEESMAASKVGRRIRVKVPVKVYHVAKLPELDLCGLEGVIKQYVGEWKGKRITANLPFKVEFLIPTEGQANPIKFFAHLKENEFEYISSDVSD